MGLLSLTSTTMCVLFLSQLLLQLQERLACPSYDLVMLPDHVVNNCTERDKTRRGLIRFVVSGCFALLAISDGPASNGDARSIRHNERRIWSIRTISHC